MDRKTLRNGFATGALLTLGASAIAWAQKTVPPNAVRSVVANGPMSLDEFCPPDHEAAGVLDSDNAFEAVSVDAISDLEAAIRAEDIKAAAAKSEAARKNSRMRSVGKTKFDESIVLTQSTSMLPPPDLPPLAAPMEQPSATVADLQTEELEADLAPLPVPAIRLSDASASAGAKRDPDFVEDAGLLRLPTLAIGDIEAEIPSEAKEKNRDVSREPGRATSETADVLERLSVAPPPFFALEPVPAVSPLTGPRTQWTDDVFREDDGLASGPPPEPEFENHPLVKPKTASPSVPDDLVDPDAERSNMRSLLSDVAETFSQPGLANPDSALVDGFEQFSGSWNGNESFVPSFNDGMLTQFGNRFARFQGEGHVAGSGNALHLAAWWADQVDDPLRPSLQSLPVDVQSLVLTALEFSPDLLAYQLEPEIVRKGICEEQAAFDWTAFSETTYDDVSDPVGNTLTTGGAARFQDHIASNTSGLRRKNEVGGEFELSQRMGWQDNNSNFFVPRQQATSRLTLSYTQPLLNQHGEAYQQSRTILAMLEAGATEDETADRIQEHLLDVTEAYWQLYRARALYLQRRNLLGEAERILATLEGRSNMDTVPRQLLRAKSAVLLRRSEITRAAMDVRNSESRLRLLVGNPQMTSGTPLELLPVEPPVVSSIPIYAAEAARTAMAHRPDIRQAVKKVRSTGVKVGITENELLPRLDVVFNGYLSGLEGDSQFAKSWGNQFADGRPSFAAGLIFEVPLGNRAAKARHHRRQLEMVQSTHELEAAVETALTEVEMAVRELETSYREMVNRYQSMQATGDEMDYLRDRWNLLPGGSSTTQLLEDLLDAQERLADDEASFVTAQVNYVMATAALRRAMGTLFQVDQPGCPSTPLVHDVTAQGPTMAPPFPEEMGL